VELFEQIRREYEHGVGSIKGVARKFGVHRRLVREAVGNAMPKPRKVPEREKPKLAAVIPWIEEMLQSDQKAPRKQRHTAHRIWRRLKAEHAEADVAESTVRRYVRQRKLELGLAKGELFIPQSYRWGQEGQVDWYEAWAEIDGECVKAYLFCLRSMASGGAFHRACRPRARRSRPRARGHQRPKGHGAAQRSLRAPPPPPALAPAPPTHLAAAALGAPPKPLILPNMGLKSCCSELTLP
jgi:hypothetical protein